MNLCDIENIVFSGQELKLSEADLKKVEDSYNFLSEFSKDKVIYGINTGFGPMAQYRVSDEHLLEFQYNII